VYLTDDERADPIRIEAVMKEDAIIKLQRALDLNGNGELTPVELRKATKYHMHLPSVISVAEALVGQARRVIMPSFNGRTFGALTTRDEIEEKLKYRESLNIIGERGVGKTHSLLAAGMSLSIDKDFRGELFYQDLKDASNGPQLRSALVSQLAVRGNSAEEVSGDSRRG